MFKLFFLALVATVVYCGTDGPVDYVDVLNFPREVELGYRLPNDTIPVRYDVTLTTHIHLEEESARDAFEGEVMITLKAVEAEVKVITLHHRQLTIEKATLTHKTEDDREVTMLYDTKYEFLTYTFETALTQDEEYMLMIEFKGTLRRDQAGFYRSSYVDEAGNRHWLATTQFESTDARHAFPCYDEPGIRAVFGITIIHGNSLVALANTRTAKKEKDFAPGYTKTTFVDTPIMQPYILCFVISDFTFIESHENVPHRVFARPSSIEAGHGDFAVRAGSNILKWLDSYVMLDYGKHNAKMDQIAIPDFSAGAMENWGLVTYRESALLFNPKTDTWGNKHSVATIIAHEFTHQYFGDWTSPAWWDYLWLNEGFANLYGYLALVNTYPEFEDDYMYQLSEFQGVMSSDGYGLLRAMTYYVETPQEISRLFDNIAYSKSGCVLRMWLHALGESTWRKGLKHYLTNRELKHATSDDLAEGLQAAVDEDKKNLSGLTMNDIVENWSRQSGFPVIHVELNDNNNHLNISQSQFIYSDNQPRADQKWAIPISISTKTKPTWDSTAKFWVKTANHDQETVPSQNLDWAAEDWIIINLKQSGYYRVNYEPKLWLRIVNALNEHHDIIDHATRTGLLNDAFNLARAELLDYATAFRLTEHLHHVTHFAPWNSVSNDLTYINRLLTDTSAHGLFHDYVRHLIAALYDTYGVRDLGDSETWGDKRAREVAIAWACRTNYENCRKDTNHMINHALEDPHKEITLSLSQIVYCAGLRASNQEEFLKFWGKQQKETDVNFRTRLLRGLGCNEWSDNQKLYLETTLSNDDLYKSGEPNVVINSVYTSTTSGLHSAIDFLTTNAKQADAKYGGVKGHASNMARLIASQGLYEKYERLLNVLIVEKIIDATDKENYLKLSKVNLEWVSANENELLDFFKDALKTGGHGTKLSIISGLLVTVVALINYIL